MIQQEDKASLSELLRFFMPLAVTSMLMMGTHTIISGGLSRTINPTVSTAAYAVALSLAAIAEAPLTMIRQVSLALVQSRDSFNAVGRVLIATLTFFMLTVLAIGYVAPLGRLVFQGVLGVSDDLLQATLKAFRITMFLPLASGLRCIYQGVIMVRRRTTYISTGMFVRVSFMIFLIFGFTRYGWVKGPLVGAITLVGGIFVEGAMAFFFGRKLIPESEATISTPAVWRFYVPLIASSLMVSMGKPFINGGLARLPDAVVALAAFSVASSFAWVFVSPSQNIHQLTMVFGRNAPNLPLIRRFSIIFAIASTVVLVTIAFSPLGHYFLQELIRVPAEMLQPTLMAVRTLSFFPLIMCWLEYNTGLLLLSQATRIVGISKATNLIATITFVVFLAPHLPGPIAAPLAQMVGFSCEGLLLHVGRLMLLRSPAEQLRPA